MRTFTEKQSQPQKRASCSLARSSTAVPEPHGADRLLTLQRTIGNQAVQRMLQAPVVHRACACGGKCPECQKKRAQQEQELPAASSGALQRSPEGEAEAAPEEETERKYKELVKEGKWCRDSEASGALHPGLQCYREVPSPRGYPGGDQVCFSKKTGELVEFSPDFVSAVSGQKSDGTCDIPMGGTDPPQPFTQRGRRALGHFAGDIATEDAHLIGRHFGRVAGVSMGIVLPKDNLDSGLATVLIPSILGFLAGELASGGLHSLRDVSKKHGFLPTVSLGAGTNLGVSLGVGYEKRNRPLPYVPINSYLTLGADTSLSFSDGTRSTFLTKVGIRIDPGKQGGVFALGALGGGLSVGKDISGKGSAEAGVGYRATDFLDIQVVRETVTGGDDDATYWLTLKLVAPQAALKEHPKR
jgi:hypothetical protein